MESIIDGTMAVMGIIAGLILVFMSLLGSEPMAAETLMKKKARPFSVKSHKQAA